MRCWEGPGLLIGARGAHTAARRPAQQGKGAGGRRPARAAHVEGAHERLDQLRGDAVGRARHGLAVVRPQDGLHRLGSLNQMVMRHLKG